ncbi:MAG: hypothetical protein R2853_19235 [Thermomicrobiales bacterium]
MVGIDDLDELKVKLIAVIIVMLGVNFLGVTELDEEGSVLEVGIAVALVVVAFAVVLWVYERGETAPGRGGCTPLRPNVLTKSGG